MRKKTSVRGNAYYFFGVRITGGLDMLAVLFAYSVMALYGQAPSASLSGAVQDEQEGVVRAAKVTLRDGGRGIVRETATDGNGAFAFAQVTPGTYELQLEASGPLPIAKDTAGIR